MTNKTLFLISVALLTLVGGCIVSDQIATLTIHADGSADWIRFQSNIRSTEPGEKGREELRRFVGEFNRRADADCLRLVKAGGEVREARWLRREEPYANVVVGRLPSAAALQEFCTIKDEKGEVMARARFSKTADRCRFSIVIPSPHDGKRLDPGKKETIPELRQAQANGISEMRVAVAAGRIVDSRGFTVASDRRSALLEPGEIHDLVTRQEKDVEVFLEWELTGNGAPRSSRL